MSVVIDSSGWIEYFTGGRKASRYGKVLLGNEKLYIPSISIFEVYRKIRKTLDESKAIFAVTQMQKAEEVPFDSVLALYAADLSILHHLPMADAIVYATALHCEAKLMTSDNDFRGLPQVELI